MAANRYYSDILIEGELSVVKGIEPRYSLEVGSTLTPNVSLYDTYAWAYPTGSLQLLNPTGSVFNGQELTISLTTASPLQISFGSIYEMGSLHRQTTRTSGSDRCDVFKFLFDTTLNKWVLSSTTRSDDRPRYLLVAGSTLSPDMSVANIYFMDRPTGTITINSPVNGFYEGEILTVRIVTDTSQALVFDPSYSIASSMSFPALTTGGGKQDFYRFYYDLDYGEWILFSKSQPEPGGGGPVVPTLVSVDLGSRPRQSGNFQLAIVGYAAGDLIKVNQVVGTGTQQDDLEWDAVQVNCIATTGILAQCYWNSSGLVKGTRRFSYTKN